MEDENRKILRINVVKGGRKGREEEGRGREGKGRKEW